MIVYSSRTGNCRHIANTLGLRSVEIEDGLLVSEPFFLLTYTDKLGEAPETVLKFMNNNKEHCKGVIASGNTNFGIMNFCGSADTIKRLYSVPVIRKMELRGSSKDFEHIKEEYKKLIRKG